MNHGKIIANGMAWAKAAPTEQLDEIAWLLSKVPEDVSPPLQVGPPENNRFFRFMDAMHPEGFKVWEMNYWTIRVITEEGRFPTNDEMLVFLEAAKSASADRLRQLATAAAE